MSWSAELGVFFSGLLPVFALDRAPAIGDVTCDVPALRSSLNNQSRLLNDSHLASVFFLIFLFVFIEQEIVSEREFDHATFSTTILFQIASFSTCRHGGNDCPTEFYFFVDVIRDDCLTSSLNCY